MKFFSRQDPEDIRFGDWAQSVKLEDLVNDRIHADVAVVGYPDDEGIRLNQGRPGAAEGPASIRNFFYRLTPSTAFPALFQIGDLGDLDITQSLETKHAVGQKTIHELTKNEIFWITLGGGHDYGYSDGSGFLKGLDPLGPRPLIMNFDAHLDVRPTSKGFHSGTPFRRLIEEFPKSFDLIQVGIQSHCNSRDHVAWAKNHGVEILNLERIQGRMVETFIEIFEEHKNRPTFISLDIDVFQNCEAPGCSQSWPGGLSSGEFFKCLPVLFEYLDIRGLGIYEVSPPLDVDQRTAKLASLCMYQTVQLMLQKGRSQGILP